LAHDLQELQPTWKTHIISASEGYTSLLPTHLDAVILDAGTDVPKQLLAALEKYPGAARVVLREEGQGAAPAPLSRPGVTFLPRSSSAATLAAAVKKDLLVKDWMSEPALKKLLLQIKKLPAVPKLHARVTQELQSQNGSLEAASQCIRQDPVMTAKFLQVVNSAYFGLAYTVTDPAEAVMFLGAERTRALILMAGVFSQFDGLCCPGFSAEGVWSHSLQVSSLARGVMLMETEDPSLIEMAFTTGLLHDIGKLILAANVPDMYATVLRLRTQKRLSLCAAEQEILGTTHARLGACLLGAWALPLPILEAIGWHHCPSQSEDKTFSVLTAVHAANVLAHESSQPDDPDSSREDFDVLYLVRVKMAKRRDFWREACGLPPKGE
jgi:HD-like signal output (HDOD) protein